MILGTFRRLVLHMGEVDNCQAHKISLIEKAKYFNEIIKSSKQHKHCAVGHSGEGPLNLFKKFCKVGEPTFTNGSISISRSNTHTQMKQQKV